MGRYKSTLLYRIELSKKPRDRRPLDDDQPDGYLESERDWVLNNLGPCVEFLKQTTRIA